MRHWSALSLFSLKASNGVDSTCRTHVRNGQPPKSMWPFATHEAHRLTERSWHACSVRNAATSDRSKGSKDRRSGTPEKNAQALVKV